MVAIDDSGIVQIPVKDFPVLAVNVLERLGYQVTRASKQLDQIIAVERVNEQIGRDWWRQHYRLTMRWSTASSGGTIVQIDLEENEGGASEEECQRRCDKLILALQSDAERAIATQATREKNTSQGAARWGTEQELKDNDYFQSKVDPKRLIIGRTADQKYIQVPERSTHAHAIICGRTGVGKSRAFFIPNLVERLGTNMLVTEATPGYEDGELYKLTSGWRKLAGHAIYCFNPADMSSVRINPIDRIRIAPAQMKTARAEQLADLIIMNGQPAEQRGDSKTWNDAEKLLLTPLLLHAAAGEPKQGHFGALRWLLLQGPDRLAKSLAKSPSRVAQMEFEGWMRLSGETNFKYGVFSGLITKLNPWMTDQMVALTETTDIDFEALKEQLFTFYLAVPSRSRDSKLIGSLLVNFLLDHILEIREKMKYPMTMLLDEFTNFGKISGIGDALSIIRKNEIGLVLGFQKFEQLEQVYSRREAQVIIDMPATQVYFQQKNFKEAKELSEAIGRTTVEEATVTDSGRVHEIVSARHLITADELISLNDEVIIFTAETKPLKMTKTPPMAYQHALSYPPPQREEHVVSDYILNRGQVAASPDEEQAPKKEPVLQPSINEKDPVKKTRLEAVEEPIKTAEPEPLPDPEPPTPTPTPVVVEPDPVPAPEPIPEPEPTPVPEPKPTPTPPEPVPQPSLDDGPPDFDDF